MYCRQGGYGVAAELLLDYNHANLPSFVHSAVYNKNMDIEKVSWN